LIWTPSDLSRSVMNCFGHADRQLFGHQRTVVAPRAAL
jgi:hypothetical protein